MMRLPGQSRVCCWIYIANPLLLWPHTLTNTHPSLCIILYRLYRWVRNSFVYKHFVMKLYYLMAVMWMSELCGARTWMVTSVFKPYKRLCQRKESVLVFLRETLRESIENVWNILDKLNLRMRNSISKMVCCFSAERVNTLFDDAADGILCTIVVNSNFSDILQWYLLKCSFYNNQEHISTSRLEVCCASGSAEIIDPPVAVNIFIFWLTYSSARQLYRVNSRLSWYHLAIFEFFLTWNDASY